METITKKLSNVEKSLDSLERAIRLYNASQDIDAKWGYRNSIIKCFEVAIDCYWKLVRVLFNTAFDKELTPPTPKNYLKSSEEQGLGNQEEIALLLQAIDVRNLTSHSYDEEAIIMLAENKIPSYVPVMKTVLMRIKKSNP